MPEALSLVCVLCFYRGRVDTLAADPTLYSGRRVRRGAGLYKDYSVSGWRRWDNSETELVKRCFALGRGRGLAELYSKRLSR